MERNSAPRNSSPWNLALLIVVTLAVRVGVLVQAGGTFSDDDSYGQLAINAVAERVYGFALDKSNKRELKWASHKANEIAKLSPSIQLADDSAVQKANLEGVLEKMKMRPTAFRPPLYPALLMAAASDGRSLDPNVVALLHLVIGLATVVIVYLIAERLELRAAWLPALAVALDPILLRGSQLLMTETLVTLWAVWAWWLYLVLVRPSMAEIGRSMFGTNLSMRVSLLLGLVLGCAVLTRPTMLPWALLTIGSLSLRSNESGTRVSMITAALLVLAALNVGWMVRNKQQLGQPIWLSTHSGYTLLLANNPALYKHFVTNGPDRNWDDKQFQEDWAKLRRGELKPAEFLATKDEMAPKLELDSNELPEILDDRLANELALATIKADPANFLRGCLYRVGWLWAVYPNLSNDVKADFKPQDEVSPSPVEANVQPVPTESGPPLELAATTEHVDATEPVDVTESVATTEQDTATEHSQGSEPVAQPSQFDVPYAITVCIGVWYSVWFLMAVMGAVYLRDAWTSRVWLMPLLLVLSITAIHAVYWSNMRMRAPLMPIVYMVACWPLMRVRTPARTWG